MDVLVGALLDEYRTEQARWRRSAAAARIETVRAIVADEPIDRTVAGRRLGYELERFHVGIVVWLEDDNGPGDPARLEAAARSVGAVVGEGRSLIVPAGQRVTWAWAGARERPDAALDALRLDDLPDGVRLAYGEPAAGIAGFRTTHEEALAARTLARTRSPAATVTRYRDVALLGLLTTDVRRARHFVARELRGLSGREESVVRLRDTLLAYFQEGEHLRRTAERLGVHQNTVANRLRQCEQLLGRPLGVRRVELQAALLVAGWLGGTGRDEW
jgi:DNA-binding PucR family transcriptional regulator